MNGAPSPGRRGEPRPVGWDFPSPCCHEGLPFANAVAGALVWGEGRFLRVTLGRTDFRDRRGGERWTARQNFRALREALERGDEQAAADLFQRRGAPESEPTQPYSVPTGLVELDLGEGTRLERGTLDIATGLGTVWLGGRDGRRRALLAQDPRSGVLAIRLPRGLRPAGKAIPAWECGPVGEELARVGVSPPVADNLADEGFFAQGLPADPAVAAGWLRAGDEIFAGAVVGRDPDAAAELLLQTLRAGAGAGFERFREAAARRFRAFWRDVPEIDVPNEGLRGAYELGMYKFESLTSPGGLPCTLQGPWTEEFRIPPWSNDYHFNINVQMCYWPAYHGNRLGNLMPLFRMVRSWWPKLRRNAKVFAGVDDGFMLPHAVDDRCTCVGGFWSGSVDHASTAWVARMMFRYVLYGGDLAFLRSDAYPFMKGTMKVFRAMMDERDGALFLPVSVSPEYWGGTRRGGKFERTCWGVNSSFQLAAAHRLCRDLVAAAAMLGEEPDPMWLDVERRLPLASVIRNDEVEQIGRDGPEHIAVWEGIDLMECQRHHSHLAGIVPFDVLDMDDPAARKVIGESYNRWCVLGTGTWAPWSYPWAAMLKTRAGEPEAAEFMLDHWRRLYLGKGHGPRLVAKYPGFAPWDTPALSGRGRGGEDREVMQVDSALAAVAAVMEMLAHERGGAVRLFKGAPASWKDASFRGILVAGGFLVDGRREDGQTREVTITATRDGTIRLENPFGPGGTVAAGDGRVFRADRRGLVEVKLAAGESVTLSKARKVAP